jgi:hypothetical protein
VAAAPDLGSPPPVAWRCDARERGGARVALKNKDFSTLSIITNNITKFKSITIQKRIAEKGTTKVFNSTS